MARVREAEAETIPLTDTCRNARLREGRKGPGTLPTLSADTGRPAGFGDVLSSPQSRGIAEGRLHPEADSNAAR